MSRAEFQAFLKVEQEKKAAIFRPSRVAQSVRFALLYPDRRLTV